MSLPFRRLLAATSALLVAVPLLVAVGRPEPVNAVPPAPAQLARPRTPEVVATDEAVRTGRRVEVAAWRSETAEVYVNPDGTKTMEQHPGPVRVRQGSGWTRPDPALVRGRDGRIRPRAAAVPLVLSGGGSGTLLTMGPPGASVSLGWPRSLPSPRLAGHIATYPEVLPGVDLQLKVAVDYFTYALVVKNRAAARNPALGKLRTPMTADGLRLAVRPNGSIVATGKSGQVIYSAPPATMWDSTPGQPREARVGVRLDSATRSLELTPDRALLTDPRAKFPLYIDPSLSGRTAAWLHVNSEMGNQTGWGYDTGQGAKVGRAYGDPEHLYRSMFLLNTTNGAQTIAGSKVSDVVFRIKLDHTPTGTATDVTLWHLNDLNPAVRVDWSNNEGYWRDPVSTIAAESWPPPEDKAVEFRDPKLISILQGVADSRKPNVSFGLRAPNENNENQWKKLHPWETALSITYNTAPRQPKSLNFLRSRPCGTAAAPTPVNTLQPQFSAVANDPDTGDQVTTVLEIRTAAGALVHTGSVGPTATGAAFAWAQLPAGVLTANTVYRYRAFTKDPVTSGPATADCYFVVDTVPPDRPTVESADFPDDEKVRNVYETGMVTFRPGGSASDVTEYRYGFSQDRLALRVKAGPGGVARVPITLTFVPETGTFDRRLYVVAVDGADNESEQTSSWTLTGYDKPQPASARNDFNGDGKADLTALYDLGFGRTAAWSVPSTPGGFPTGVMSWDTGEVWSFALTRTRAVQGDVNADGRSDLVVFREGSGRQIWLHPLISEGHQYDAKPSSWSSGRNGWPLSTARVLSGDVDGDGKADVAVQNALPAGGWEVLVFSGADGLTRPVSWLRTTAAGEWAKGTPVLADVDGDRKTDLVNIRNQGGCRTTIEVHRSTGTGFGPATAAYDSGAGGYCWEKSKPVVADPDGDGREDIVTLYENDTATATLYVFKPSGTSLVRSTWSSAANDLDLSKASLSAGDYTGDRKDDIALIYACCTTGERQAHFFPSTGSSFGTRQQSWSGQVGAVAGPKFELEHRAYDLVSRNSNKCLNVEFASTGDLARYIQYQCLPVDLNARFRVDAVAGTDQYSLRPMHSVKCADVGGFGLADDTQVIQWPCGNGNGEPTANQQVTIEYVEGTSYDTVVQLRFAHSQKCATVRDDPGKGVTAFDDYAPVKQVSCGQLTTQQWILRPSFNATQLGEGGNGRYRIEAATSTNAVLDIQDCAKTDNVRMWMWVPGSPCQSWKLESLGDDLYKIVDPSTNRALDIQGCSKLARGTVIVFTSNQSECQRWRIEPSPDGTFSVTAASSGLSLDVAGCKPDHGTDVLTWPYHGKACHRWIFRKVN